MAAPEKDKVAADEVEEQTAEAAAEDMPEETPEEAEPEVVEGEPVEDDEAEEAEGGEAGEDGQADIFTAIKQEVTELRESNADLRDRYTRLQAEWDNYRKRTAAERAAERVRAAEGLVEDLLPVLDDLERAVKHAKDAGDGGSLTEGVEAIQGKFLQILGKHKVEQVEAEGQPFDAMQHQAVGTAEDESVPEETVVQVYQQGYKMGDRVLRPAMVVTSTGGPARETEAGDGENEE